MATVQVRVSDELKKNATELFNSLGLTLSDAIRVFLTQSTMWGEIPFKISTNIPNEETIKAFNEPVEPKRYKTAKEMFEDFGLYDDEE